MIEEIFLGKSVSRIFEKGCLKGQAIFLKPIKTVEKIQKIERNKSELSTNLFIPDATFFYPLNTSENRKVF